MTAHDGPGAEDRNGDSPAEERRWAGLRLKQWSDFDRQRLVTIYGAQIITRFEFLRLIEVKGLDVRWEATYAGCSAKVAYLTELDCIAWSFHQSCENNVAIFQTPSAFARFVERAKLGEFDHLM